MLVIFIKILIIVILVLISVAYFTLVERKILGSIQRRRGPDVIGIYGILQPLSDGLKLFMKEAVIPSNSNKIVFIISPIITFTISLLGWSIIPFDKYATLSEINVGILYLLAVSSLGVYGIIASGWSSNSKYAFLGALRSTAQMISYEVSIGFMIITVCICCGSFSLKSIIETQNYSWFVVPFLPLFLIFFTSGLAETNRHPFDLPEAEAELVSGYNVEYSAMGFALFSLGEYGNMLIMSSLNVLLFFGGWLSPVKSLTFVPGALWFSLKLSFFVILFVWVRAALPRYRYDQLMNLGWKIFLPISLTYLVFVFCIITSFDLLPC